MTTISKLPLIKWPRRSLESSRKRRGLRGKSLKNKEGARRDSLNMESCLKSTSEYMQYYNCF